MIIKKIGDLQIYQFENLSNYPEIKQFVSTRKEGKSKPPFESLNMSIAVGDDFNTVINNRKLLAKAVEIPYEYFVFPQQRHTANVIKVTTEMRDNWWDDDKMLENCDSMITNNREVALVVAGADCVPHLFFDPVKKVIGTAHSGWKGTYLKIVQNTIERMKEEFGTDPKDLIVGIGPSIGPDSYEVDIQVIEKFKETGLEQFIQMKNETHGMLNLWETNKYLLLESGVLEHNIEISGIDTYTNTDTFYSDRKQRPTGRFIGCIMLN